MNNKNLTPRQRRRNKAAFPAGMYAALLTAVCITLIGVIVNLDPAVILSRAAMSALIIGGLVSFGMSIVRMTLSESKAQRNPRR